MSPLAAVALARLSDVTLSLPEFLQALRRQGRLAPLLRDALADKLLFETARQAGLTVTEAEFQQAADRFRYRHGLTAADQFHQWLTRGGVSLEEFESSIERDLLRQKLKEHLAARGRSLRRPA
jgi:hypothetical protein